jgi:5,10-methylene-tetrahydrofolate dehydrogenase/methenyl tetrahydrofolate cyclohydrolase
METTQFAKQTLGFQKTILESSFNAMIMIQDQTEKMVNGYLNQLPLVTEDGKKSLQTSIDMAKKARDDFKKSVDDGFSKIEALLEEKK